MTSTPPKTVLAVSGSLRHGSTNTLMLQAVADRLRANVTMIFFDGLDDLPHFSPERDADHESGTASLPAVAHWRAAIEQADAVLISTPEYAFGIPGVLKNALDCLVRPKNCRCHQRLAGSRRRTEGNGVAIAHPDGPERLHSCRLFAGDFVGEEKDGCQRATCRCSHVGFADQAGGAVGRREVVSGVIGH